ncbi:MAG: hypothetical protein AAFZ18_39750 [Myxococcota bacterium]
MTAAFSAAGIGFELDDGFTVVPFEDPQLVVDETFGDRLPEGAPKDGWLASRLTALVGGEAPVFGVGVEIEPDGLWIADVLALDEEGKVLAKLQLQATAEAAAVGAATRDATTAIRVTDAFSAALLADPERLADVEVLVSSNDEEAPRHLGRRDGEWLGQG